MSTPAINLIPLERREARRRRRHGRAWLAAGALYALLLGGAWLITPRVLTADEGTLNDDLASATASLEQTRGRVETLRGELTELTGRLHASITVDGQPDWSILLAILAASLEDEVVLRTVRLEPDRPRAAAPGTPGAAGAQVLRLTLEGLGSNQQAVTRYVLRLEETQLFDQIKLTDSRREAWQDGDAAGFTLDCLLRTAEQPDGQPGGDE